MGRFLKFMLMFLLLAMVISGMVSAQDKIPLEMGKWVGGELTSDQYETKYTFSGKAGQLVMGVMMANVEEDSLDAFLVLRTSDGDILGQNDDVLDGFSLVVASLPTDGEYTLLATRSGGKDGASEGKYWIRLDEVQPLTAGVKTTLNFTTDDEKGFPTFYVLAPESSESLRFAFNLSSGSRYPQIGLYRWVNDDYSDILMWGEYMSRIGNLSFSADLEADTFYVLMIDPIPVFYGSDDMAALAFSVN